MDLSSLSQTTVFISTAVVVLTAILWLVYRRNTANDQGANYPPIDSGWVPWLGCAIEFGKAPLFQIQAKRKQLGPIFTLYIAGKRLTFLTSVEDFHHFFKSPNVDFQEAVVDAVNHTAAIPKPAFYESHTKLHDTVKGRLSAQSLEQIGNKLCVELNEVIADLPDTFVGDSFELIRKLMYKSAINILFGRNSLGQNKEEFEKVIGHFVKFDQGFEYGSQLPELFLRDWANSKHWLLSKFKSARQSIEKGSKNDQTLFHSIVETVGMSHSHSFGLLFMWAALSNAVPIAFWALVHIAANPDVLRQVKEEIRAVLGNFKKGKSGQISDEDIRRMPFAKSCVLETVRLHSAGVIARKVLQSFKIKGYTIPAGDMLIVSPYWAHRNPNYFPQPSKFNPDRWKDVDLEKKKFLEGFIAFGSGRYQCPGRWFALLEMQMFVSLFLWKYDVRLLNGVPQESPLHVVGTQHPVSECKAEFTLAV
ncbi:24-hydroxycholesterol 7-alpha-hydroxylase-like [Liolophura sinensis]|uniref:24-hydroxycholesterol 7-alpha-hydroxylase-like n=1 Tax=Liolophura sinensis TaxID=3198878 RepID=UPI0031597CDA